MIDYLEIAQKYHGGRNDGFLTDQPRPIQLALLEQALTGLADDDYIRVRYDAKAMSSPTPKAYGDGYRLDHRGLSIQRHGS